jgi:glycosyltransferase involved in cell wall biosynthesis
MKNSILFLTNAYPDSESSYRGVFIKKLASLLQKDGYQISVVTPKIYKESPYFEEQNGVEVYRFPFFARSKLLIEYEKIPYLKMILYYITGFFLTIYAVFKNKSDVIHIHWAIPTGLVGVCVGSLLRKPLIVTVHGSDLRMAVERHGFLRKVFMYVCKKTTHLNCVSEAQKKEIERLGVMVDKMSVIPMGIDDAFLEMGKNRKIELNKHPFTILSNRNLLPMYNVSLLIRAIPIVLKEEPQTKFLIAGDGAEKEALEREVKNLNINSSVKILGRVPHEEMPGLLSQSDIYVSTSPFDGTSVSLLEAMGSGAFPIVTDIPSNREWIADGDNGFLVPLDEERFVAEKIVEAIRNRDLMEKSRDKNFCLIKEKALWPVTIAKTKGIYKMALDSKS